MNRIFIEHRDTLQRHCKPQDHGKIDKAALFIAPRITVDSSTN